MAGLTCSACKRPDLQEKDFGPQPTHIKAQPAVSFAAPVRGVPCRPEKRRPPAKRPATTKTFFSADDPLSDDDDFEDDLVAAGLEDEDVPTELPDLTDSGPASRSSGGLTCAALAKHEQRTEVVERRQFNCPQHGTFWKKCCARKPVAHCPECKSGTDEDGPKYVAIPKEEERGRGLFKCGVCGNQWTSNTACRGLAQYCQGKGCHAIDHQIGTFPHQMRPQLPRWKLKERREAAAAHRQERMNNGGGGGGGGNGAVAGGGGGELEAIAEDCDVSEP